MKDNLLYIYAWSMAMFFGAILSETVMLYPNIFYQVPESLEAAGNFLKVIGPAQFFPKLGAGLLLISIATLIVNRHNRPALRYIILSFALLFIFEFLFSILYFWPRNRIMFLEGIAMHSPQELKKVAFDFKVGHILRLTCALVTSIIAFMGLKKSVGHGRSTLRHGERAALKKC